MVDNGGTFSYAVLRNKRTGQTGSEQPPEVIKVSDNDKQATVADQILEALTATPVTVAELAEKIGRSESAVKRAFGKLAEADEVPFLVIEGEGDEPDRYRTPKGVRANHGYQRNDQTGRHADERDAAVLQALDSAGSPQTYADLAKMVAAIEGREVTPRQINHSVWRMRADLKPTPTNDREGAPLKRFGSDKYGRVEWVVADDEGDDESTDESNAA